MPSSDYDSSGHLTREAQQRRNRETNEGYHRGIDKMKKKMEKRRARREAQAKKAKAAAKAAKARQPVPVYLVQ